VPIWGHPNGVIMFEYVNNTKKTLVVDTCDRTGDNIKKDRVSPGKKFYMKDLFEFVGVVLSRVFEPVEPDENLSGGDFPEKSDMVDPLVHTESEMLKAGINPPKVDFPELPDKEPAEDERPDIILDNYSKAKLFEFAQKLYLKYPESNKLHPRTGKPKIIAWLKKLFKKYPEEKERGPYSFLR
jgi:hypothetical protein